MLFKRKSNFVILFSFIILFIFSQSVFSVGLTRVQYDLPKFEFQPGLHFSIAYAAKSATRDTLLSISGEMAEFCELSREKILLSDPDKKFSISCTLPSTSENLRPGQNGLSLLVKDDLSNLPETSGMITTTEASSSIIIYVPYPGKYAEISEFKVPHVNTGLNTSLSFTIWNRGKEDLYRTSYKFTIKNSENPIVISKNGLIDVNSQEKEMIQEKLETDKLSPGHYNATLEYSYADQTKSVSVLFIVGYLNIEVVDWSKQLFNDSLQKVDVKIQSDWNNPIKNVYAELDLDGRTGKTSPADLSNFEEKILTTYIDTTGLSLGNYSADLTLFYAENSKQESLAVELIDRPEEVIEKEPFKIDIVTLLIIMVAILLIISITFIVMMVMHSSKNKK